MALVLAAVALLAGFALLPLLWPRTALAAVGGALSCLLGLAGAAAAAVDGASAAWTGPWGLPIGALRLGLDPLSAVFLCVLFGAGLPCAVYGGAYLRSARVAALFNALLACVALVFLARDGVLFLMAWEGMSTTAFLLVAHEHEREEVRRGALWFFVFSHFGVACLFGFFALLGRETGSFALPSHAVALAPGVSVALLVLSLLGFGVKAGLWPLHAWLPAAHPVAPSHVSALLSGVLLKAGIYGLLRTLLLVRDVPVAAGWTLVALGAASGVIGGARLLKAADLKQSLAYSSIENIGVIALSMGLGVVGRASGWPLLAALGFAGALMHCLSHAAFKSLLFLSAGSAVHAAHTRQMDLLGGLAKRMPATGALFLLGGAAAAAVPGLAGFASEFFVYRGLFEAVQRAQPAGQAGAAVALSLLAFTGGLAAAGAARAWGICFGGSPRSEAAGRAREQPAGMVLPMIALALACAFIGFLPRLSLALLGPALQQLGASVAALAGPAAQAATAGAFGGALLALTAWLFVLRARAVGRAAEGATWGCGYAEPTPRMQYTAPSFSGPLVQVLRGTALATPDEPAIERALAWAGRKSAQIRALHRPRLQQYVVYVFVALLILLSYAARLVRT